jgi:hypothetical protein
MSVFAGFWVDGAVRKPEARHADKEGCIIGRWKCFHEADFDLFLRRFDNWREVYWLDTTPRESLTPEELLSVVKVIWPKCKSVFDPGNGAVVGWQVQRDETEDYTPVEWNGIGIYPPPTELQWLRVTRENVGQYLFRECRCKEHKIVDDWYAGTIVGWDVEDGCCLVDTNYDSVIRVLKWDIVEVTQ